MGIEIIGVPFDYCGAKPGSRLGPGALRIAGLMEQLKVLEMDPKDTGDLDVASLAPTTAGIKNFDAGFKCVSMLKEKVMDSLKREQFPIVLGGDHFVCTGSIGAALQTFGSQLSLLWVDAHADLNTPGTSTTGNMHGMPVAALIGFPSGVTGLEDEQWRRLTSEVVTDRLKSDHIGWIGIRDLDVAERDRIRNFPKGFLADMHQLDRHGVEGKMYEWDKWLRKLGVQHIWLSLDVDALDSVLAPGTGTPVRGGLTYREMHLIGELLNELLKAPACPYKLVGIDLMETNPLMDNNNVTATMAVEWIASIFGKVIL